MPLADLRMIFAKLKNNSTIAIRNRRLKIGFKKTKKQSFSANFFISKVYSQVITLSEV